MKAADPASFRVSAQTSGICRLSYKVGSNRSPSRTLGEAEEDAQMMADTLCDFVTVVDDRYKVVARVAPPRGTQNENR